MAHKPGAVHIGEEGSNTYVEFPTFPTIRGKGPEFKGRIKLDSSEGFEDLVTQFESENNKTIFGQRKTVSQDVDDYQGHGPGRVIYQDKTNAGPAGMYFIPSNTGYNKGLAKDINDLNNVFNAAQTLFTLGVGTKGVIRQRTQQKIQLENLAFEGATNITPKGPSNVTGATTKGDIKPGTIFKDGVPVSPGYEVGYKSYLAKGGDPKNYGIAQNVKMQLNIAKSILNGEPIPKKPHVVQNPGSPRLIQRQNEQIAIAERNAKLDKLKLIAQRQGKTKVNPNDVRDIMSEIGSDVHKWFDQPNQLPEIRELKPVFLKHYKERSNLLTKYHSQIKHVLGLKGMGIDTNTGHIVSLKGSPDLESQPLTPTSSIDIVGSDLSKYVEEGRSNRRHGEYNLFKKDVLQLIGRPSTQMEQAINFVNERPDLTTRTLEDEIVEGIKMNQLARGDITPESLEIQEMIEKDLERSGIKFDNSNNKAILKAILVDMYKKDIIQSATDPILLLKQGKIQPGDKLLSKKAWLATAGRRGDLTVRQAEAQWEFREAIINDIIRQEKKLIKYDQKGKIKSDYRKQLSN